MKKGADPITKKKNGDKKNDGEDANSRQQHQHHPGLLSRLRVTDCVHDQHCRVIYGTAWSKDVYSNSSTNRKQGEANMMALDGYSSPTTANTSTASTSSASQCLNHKRSTPPEDAASCYRYLATCGGRYVTVYETKIAQAPVKSASSRTTARSNVKQKKRKKSDSMDEFVSHDGHGPLRLKQSYVDENKAEEFYRCVFAGRSLPSSQQREGKSDDIFSNMHKDGDDLPDRAEERRQPQLLCVAGKTGIIHIIDTVRRRRIQTLTGHGDEVLDLKACPTNDWLLLSASQDESIRLWELHPSTLMGGAGGCCALRMILAGPAGHKDFVITVAWHASGQRIVSGGMDTTVKLWDITTATNQDCEPRSKELPKAFSSSKHKSNGEDRQVWTKTEMELFPIFSTKPRGLHLHCVDCVEFVGDLILSKSIPDAIELWAPILPLFDSEQDDDDKEEDMQALPACRRYPPPSDYVHLRTFRYSNGSTWYMQFTINPSGTLLAVGDTKGQLYVWKIGGRSDKYRKLSLLPQQNTCIRSTAFSPDGATLVASTETGCIVRVAGFSSFDS